MGSGATKGDRAPKPRGVPKVWKGSSGGYLRAWELRGALKPDMPAGADHVSCALTRQAKNQALVDVNKCALRAPN